MIFTTPIANNGSPEEQIAAGHGLTFTSGNYTLSASNTSPPPGMTGFRDAAVNPACSHAYLLSLNFSAAPSNWRIEMGVNNFFNKANTWNNAEVGNLALDTFIAQPSNASAAVQNDHIRLLVPQIASNITSVRITLGATEQSHLLSANFHRVVSVLYPSPRFRRAELAAKKRTEEGVDGRTHVVLADADPIMSCELLIEAWESERDLLDVNELVSQTKFGLWPSGLQPQFTRANPVIYRRPDFVRNCVVADSSGLMGAEGLDHPEGPVGIRLKIEESF